MVFTGGGFSGGGFSGGFRGGGFSGGGLNVKKKQSSLSDAQLNSLLAALRKQEFEQKSTLGKGVAMGGQALKMGLWDFPVNALKNIGQIGTGLLDIGKGALSAATHPTQTIERYKQAKQAGTIGPTLSKIGGEIAKDVGESFAFIPSFLTAEPIRNVLKGKDFYKGTGIEKSAQKLFEKPIEFAADVSLIAPITSALGKATKAGKIAEATGAAKILDKGTKPLLEGISKIEEMPAIKSILDIGKGPKRQARREIRTLQSKFYADRDKYVNDVYQKLEKPLKEAGIKSEEFGRQIVPVIEGRASLIPGAIPKAGERVVSDMRQTLDGIKNWYIENGYLKNTDFAQRAAMPPRTIVAWNMFKKLPGQLSEIEIAKLNKAMKPLDGITAEFFPHIQPKRWKISQLFLNKPGTKRTPSTLKQMTGSSTLTDDFMKSPFEVTARHGIDQIALKHFQDISNTIITKFSTRKLKAGDEVAEGMKVFAPEGFMRMFRTKVDLGEELLKALDNANLDQALSNSLTEAITKLGSEMGSKTMIGFTKKVPLYEIPADVAKVIQDEFTTYFGRAEGWLRTIYDKPMDAWRIMTLALSPRWLVNNFIGGGILATLAGTNPTAYIKSLSKEFDEFIPREVSMGMHSLERGLTGIRPGQLAPTELGGVLKPFQKGIEGVKKVANISYRVNEWTDNMFRKAVYIDEATKLARKKVVAQTGQKLIDTTDALKVVLKDPELVEQAIRKVEEFLGDFKGLSAFERKGMRRVFPFWTWVKHINKLAITYPIRHPIGDQLIDVMAEIASIGLIDDQEEFEQNAPEYLKSEVVLDRAFNKFTTFSLQGMNPFTGIGELGVSSMGPILGMAYELSARKDSFTGKPFSSPALPYPQYSGGEVPITPGLIKQQAVESTPLLQTLQNVIKPYKKYSTGEPMIRDRQKINIPRSETISKILGFPVSTRETFEPQKNTLEEQKAKNLISYLTAVLSQ